MKACVFFFQYTVARSALELGAALGQPTRDVDGV